MLRRRCHGLGPLFFFEGEAPGGTPPADGGATGAGGAPPAPPVAGPASEDRAGWIPRDRFDLATTELAALKREKEERTAKELADKGQHEQLAANEKAKREAAEARAVHIARRAAFVAGASGKVADVEAAYKLAQADGMLNDLDVDDDGNAKDQKKVEGIVADIVKRYEFLKQQNGTGRGYGGDKGGQDTGPVDTSKMTGLDMLQAGYGASKPR